MLVNAEVKRASFKSFMEQKIKEAKDRRLKEEMKLVDNTPLSTLFKLLAKGRRDSIFDKEN